MNLNKKNVPISDLLDLKRKWTLQNKKIVLCQGCFDILHRGHIHLLSNANELGDILIVAINSDKSIKELKGYPRPIIPVEDRAFLLSAIEYVDYVTIFDSMDARDLITNLRPDVYVDDNVRGHETIEAKTVSEYGGKLAKVQYLQNYSTTKLIQQIINAHTTQFVEDSYH